MSQRIVLVGAPDSGKTLLAEKIRDRNPHLTRQKPMDLDAAFGLMADYRVELQVALDRMWFIQDEEFSVSTHSLLDSAVYSLMKLQMAIETGHSETSIRAAEITALVAISILIDTFRYDVICFLPGGDEEISTGLLDILAFENLPYIEMSGNADVDADEITRLVAGTHDVN
jgi:hypothetical protein